MSGGSWDYITFQLDSVADRLIKESVHPKRKVLGALVRKIAKAMHDIEWVDSGDSSPGSEIEAINLALNLPAIVEESIKEQIEELKNNIKELEAMIKKEK